MADKVCFQEAAKPISTAEMGAHSRHTRPQRIRLAVIQPKAIRTFPPPNAAVSTLFCARAGLFQMQLRTLGGYSVLWRAIGGIWRAAPGEEDNFVYAIAL
ncbi:hypothetical protein [Mesorhizobium xinjiangense]|uniref:hypothetical protein n=1 Tax=Mesorhizobium xinjiangense TaxID=2678685 RepID=UPI0012ED9C8C|nr:hypothetical protein [Mesorhizobium xinjiangense]